MPIYEYECRKCGKHFEKLVPRAGVEVVCEACGSKDVVKQFSVFAATPSQAAGKNCANRENCQESSHQCGCNCGCHHHH